MKDSQQNPEVFSFKKIGHVQSGYPEKFGVPRQSGLVKTVDCSIKIDSQYQPEISLLGLEKFSHLWVIFVFHLNESSAFHAKVHPPRLLGESIGVFATRSPHRPNPIGLSLVEIKKVYPDRIEVDGIDLVHGTPVIDIKPYLPQFEAQTSASAGWSDEQEMAVEISVEFTEPAFKQLKDWVTESGRLELEQVIVNLIRQDPRPVVYRGHEKSGGKYREDHVFRLYDKDIRFKFFTSDKVFVTAIEKFFKD